MSTTSKSNFLNNAEDIINNVINNKDFMTIKTEDGNVVLITEDEYERLVMNVNLLNYYKSRAGD